MWAYPEMVLLGSTSVEEVEEVTVEVTTSGSAANADVHTARESTTATKSAKKFFHHILLTVL